MLKSQLLQRTTFFLSIFMMISCDDIHNTQWTQWSPLLTKYSKWNWKNRQKFKQQIHSNFNLNSLVQTNWINRLTTTGNLLFGENSSTTKWEQFNYCTYRFLITRIISLSVIYHFHSEDNFLIDTHTQDFMIIEPSWNELLLQKEYRNQFALDWYECHAQESKHFEWNLLHWIEMNCVSNFKAKSKQSWLLCIYHMYDGWWH